MLNERPHLAVIEDDEEIRELILAWFRSKNFATSGFADATSFLTFLQDGSRQVDVIISDLKLPDIEGTELTRQLRASGRETPLILLTAEKSSEAAIEAIEAGAYDFIVKPLSFPQLQVSVDRAIHFHKIQAENHGLKAVMNIHQPTAGIIGKSPGLLKAIDLAKRVAGSTTNIFISGETGSGKEVIARAIHNFGPRAKEPFLAINCSAIPENLLESELFGHAKGSFTGATDKKAGLFEEAGGGTLFLDEIGDLSASLQAKLLRVLQERKIRRIGEAQSRPFKARIISATHKDLRKAITEKQFREDLFFRLNVIPINLPPLRERKEDILPLAEYFLKKYSALNQRKLMTFSKDCAEKMLKCVWQGNVRELENAIERAVVLCQDNDITWEDLQCFEEGSVMERASVSASSPSGPSAPVGASVHELMIASMPSSGSDGFHVAMPGALLPLDELSNMYIDFAVSRNGGAKDKTARDLGIDRKTLYRKLAERNQKPLVSMTAQ